MPVDTRSATPLLFRPNIHPYEIYVNSPPTTQGWLLKSTLLPIRTPDAIQSSVQSLASQEEVLQNMQARLHKLGLPTQLRSLQALTQGIGRSLITVLDDEGGVSAHCQQCFQKTGQWKFKPTWEPQPSKPSEQGFHTESVNLSLRALGRTFQFTILNTL